MANIISDALTDAEWAEEAELTDYIRMANRIKKTCQSKSKVLSLTHPRRNQSSEATFDNCTTTAQNNASAMLPQTGDDDTKQLHRIRVCIGHDAEGQPILRQVSAKTESELGDAIVRAYVESGRINEFIPEIWQSLQPKRQEAEGHTNFARYFNHWRQLYKDSSDADNTKVFRDAKASVLLRYFDNSDIESITPDDVQSFLNDRARQFKKATVKADWAMLKEVLDSAVDDGIIAKNPAKDRRLKNPATEGEGTKALTVEQCKAIRDAIPTLTDDRERMLIALLAYTSMRREEVLGLTWECVHFDTGTIEIRQAVTYPTNKPVIKETKTKSSERFFPMANELREILLPCRKQTGYVISKSNGEPISQVTYRRLYESIADHIDLYGATAMNFRTSFATNALAAGVDVKTAQLLMGHSTPEMTLKVYAKGQPAMLPQAVETIGKFIEHT